MKFAGILSFLISLLPWLVRTGNLPFLSPSLFDPTKRYVVVPVDVLGLANRLRIIASSYAIAQASNRTLVVIWAPSEECNVEFDDLFDLNIDNVDNKGNVIVATAGRHGPLSNADIRADFTAIHSELNCHVIVRYPKEFFVDVSFLVPTDGDVAVADIVVLRSASTHAPIGMSCSQYIQLKLELYRYFTPVPAVRAWQQEVLGLVHSRWNISLVSSGSRGSSSNMRGPIVGVHVRSHDDAYDWAVVAPEYASVDAAASGDRQARDVKPSHNGPSSSQRALTFDESTPLLSIIAAMEDIADRHPDARFFLASNSERVKEAIISHFNGDNNSNGKHGRTEEDVANMHEDVVLALQLTSNGWGSRGSTHAMQMALLELSLLGGLSDILLHSKGSSFAVEGSYFPSLLATDGSPLLEHDRLRVRSQGDVNTDASYWQREAGSPVPVVDIFAVSAQSLGPGSVSAEEMMYDGRVRLNVYMMDSSLSQCGLTDYLNNVREKGVTSDCDNSPLGCVLDNENSDGDVTDKVCYREAQDTTDNSAEHLPADSGRMVCSHRLRVHRCRKMQEVWGLQHLYCVPRNASTELSDTATLELDAECMNQGTCVIGFPESLYVLLDISGYSASH